MKTTIERIYKEASRKSGVYKLTNKLNGRVYYGSCKEFKERWKQHEHALTKGKHSNRFLQFDFNKCRAMAFVFEVIEVIEGEQEVRLLAEQKLLDQYWDGCKQCYNLNKLAKSAEGRNFSKTPEETKEKMSKSHKENPTKYWTGKRHSEETKEKISKTKKGTPAWNKNIKGLHLSPQTEFKKGIIPWNKGKTHSKESRKKMSESHKGKTGYWKDKKRSSPTKETKKKISKSNKKAWMKRKLKMKQ